MMLSKVFRYLLLSFVVFIGIYFIHQELIKLLNIDKQEFVNRFYFYITVVSFLMLVNMFMVYVIKHKYVGYTFLAWSMLKLMLVMGYFVMFVLVPKISLSNTEIYEIVGIYLLYLIYEVFLGILLLKPLKIT